MSRSKSELPQEYAVAVSVLLVLMTAVLVRHVVNEATNGSALVPTISWSLAYPLLWIILSGLIAAALVRRFVSPLVAVVGGALAGGLAGWPFYSALGIICGMVLGFAVTLERTSWLLQLVLRMSLVGFVGHTGVGWARSCGIECAAFANRATIALFITVGLLQAGVVLVPIWRQLQLPAEKNAYWRKLTTSLCVGTFWFLSAATSWMSGWHGELKRRVLEIESTGGKVAFERSSQGTWYWDWRIPRAWNVELVDPPPTQIATLKGIPKVNQLALSGATIDDLLAARMPHWGQTPQLTLRKTRVTGAFLEAGSTRTEDLIVEYSPISDASMKWVAQMKQLRSLSLVETPVAAVGLQALAGCVRLSQLTLRSSLIQDTDIKSLQGLKVQLLELDCPRVTEDGLSVLSSLPRLESVSLGNHMSIGPHVVLQLGAIRTLTSAHLFFNSLTPDIVQALKALEQQGMNLYVRTIEADRQRRHALERELKFIDLRFLHN
ncbi:MAG TPA: hypothetical protein DCE55_09620 [Planctomycetaceae bacterium]|nr:hypothetical protein [Planctomycetaceae bacterium]